VQPVDDEINEGPDFSQRHSTFLVNDVNELRRQFEVVQHGNEVA